MSNYITVIRVKRREQNQARREWEELKQAVAMLDPIVTTVLLRGTHDSGLRRAKKDGKNDPEKGTPPPAWADETGEAAIRDVIGDGVERSVVAMAKNIHEALNNAKVILAITPSDVADRAMRTVPPCIACGDPCHGGVRSGFDDKCRKRYERAGHPDRTEFIAMVKRERAVTLSDD